MSTIEAATPTSIQLSWESQTKQRPVRVHSSFAPFATMLRGPWVPASCKPWLAQSVPATKPDAQKAYQSGKCCKNTLCSFFAASWIRHRKRCISAARRKAAGRCRCTSYSAHPRCNCFASARRLASESSNFCKSETDTEQEMEGPDEGV